MAQLNLRERVVETTIAYVSANAGAGRRNLEEIQRDTHRGRAGVIEESTSFGVRWVSLEWHPREGPALNDCELRVRIVAADEPADADAMQRVLADADGMVLALDADAGKEPENMGAIATVKAARGRGGSRVVPVVVQLDTGADEPAGLVDEWPRVTGSARKGEGAMETLQRAVEVVVDSMQSRTGDSALPRAPLGPSSPRVEGNPLLGALRQIIQTTVAEQVTRLEDRLVDRLDEIRKASDAADRMNENQLRSIVDQLDGICARLDAMGMRFQHTDGDVAHRIVEVRDALRVLGDRSDAPAESIRTEIRTLIDELRDKTRNWFT